MPRHSKLVISDTHIGAGGSQKGNKLEDFISDVDFTVWLHSQVAESDRDGTEMELIINGDWIEFLQVPGIEVFDPSRPYEAAAYNDPGEKVALQRLEIVYTWHPGVFLSLKRFLNAAMPKRSVTILFGNHDPELAYPAVQDRLRDMIGATGDRATLLEVGQRSYFRDGVYIEHGNAYTESVDRFQNPDEPFDPADATVVERPAGSRFVTNFFNGLEWQRPWIDGVHPVTALIFYAFAFEPVLALTILQRFLAIAPGVFLSAGEGMEAATPAQGKPGIGDQLLAQIDDPVQAAALVQRLQSDPAFANAFAAQVEQALAERGAVATPRREIAGAPASVSALERGRAITEQFWRALEEQAEITARETGARVVLFGHIHVRVDNALAGGARYLNTGTWIWNGDFRQAPDALWQDLFLHPERYSRARDLTFARIDFDETGTLTSARLERVGAEPAPPVPPRPAPRPGPWARFVLAIRGFLLGLAPARG